MKKAQGLAEIIREPWGFLRARIKVG